MSQTIADKYISQYRHCIPVNSLVKEAFERLCAETEFCHYTPQQTIFSLGDNDEYTLFLLDGSINLIAKDGKKSQISLSQRQSLYAIAALKPRLFSAEAEHNCLIAQVKTHTLDKLLIWEQGAHGNKGQSYDISISELEDEDSDWKMAMLQTQTFLSLPSENILSLFSAMEPIAVKQGDTIIRQGEPGDYYYIIKEGYCEVSRSFQDDMEPVVLNKLGPTDCFGEEALLSGETRNATITMLSDGVLMRLSKTQFHTLLEAPLLQFVNIHQAQELIQQGAIAIDVRNEDEYAHSGIKNTLNIPLYLLRLQLSGMNIHETFVLFCDSGSRSAAAAFLMKQSGFKDVFVLENGLSGVMHT